VPTFYIDGGSRGNERKDKPRTAKIVIVYLPSSSRQDPQGSRVYSEGIGDKTNNEAEYHALLRLLSIIAKQWTGSDGKILAEVGKIRVLTDSKLLVNQVNGSWKIKEDRLRRLWSQARAVIDSTGSISLEWVPREQNHAGLWFDGKWDAKQVAADQLLKG